MATPAPRAPRIKIDGVAAGDALLGRLVDLRVDRRLNLTGSATIRCSGAPTGLSLKMGSKVEIAAPAGSDLSGYQLVVVEGNQLCGTGTAANGAASLAVTIPNGTVIADDTGTGIGFLVACFANTITGG